LTTPLTLKVTALGLIASAAGMFLMPHKLSVGELWAAAIARAGPMDRAAWGIYLAVGGLALALLGSMTWKVLGTKSSTPKP